MSKMMTLSSDLIEQVAGGRRTDVDIERFAGGWICNYPDGSAVVNHVSGGVTTHLWLSADRTQSRTWNTVASLTDAHMAG
jgi:hypothetical protein